MNFSFGRSKRLCSKHDFKKVFDKKDICISHKYFLILAKRKKKVANLETRIGLIVAKKYVRNAVDRNKLKRCIRENFRTNQNIMSNLDIVLLVRKGVDKLSNNKISTVLNKQWIKLSNI